MKELIRDIFNDYLKLCETMNPERALKQTMEDHDDEIIELMGLAEENGYDKGYDEGYDRGYDDAMTRVQRAIDGI